MLFSLFRLVFRSASSVTWRFVCSGCGFLQLVYAVRWLWLLVTLSASVVGIWSDMILFLRRFMNTLLLFTILGNSMAASSVGISACSFGKFLGSMPEFLYPSLPVPDVVAPSWARVFSGSAEDHSSPNRRHCSWVSVFELSAVRANTGSFYDVWQFDFTCWTWLLVIDCSLSVLDPSLAVGHAMGYDFESCGKLVSCLL